MRKGKNKNKNKLLDITPCDHRVIIPLHIPRIEDYYQEAFKVFKICIQSIIKTSCSPLKISVISNGCCKEVNDQLYKMQRDNVIDELIIEKEAIGKINSILKALRTAEERLITITDADVLFLNNWEEEVLKIFKSFPKAGMVSPVPIFRTHLRYTSNIWFDYLFSEKLKFRPVKNPVAMTKFANSLGWSYLSDKLKDVILTLKARNNTIAVVGNAHFVGTYKNEVFKLLPKVNSKYKLGGSSEKLYTDLPVMKSGGYRLATYDNYAYHMGNTIENWIEKEFNDLIEEKKVANDFKNLSRLKQSKFNYFISEKIIAKLFFKKSLKRTIFRKKGLTNVQINNFLNENFE